MGLFRSATPLPQGWSGLQAMRGGGVLDGRCVAAGSFLQPRPEEVWVPAGGAPRAFQGRAVYLHGDAGGSAQQLSVLLQHAGGAPSTQLILPFRTANYPSSILQPA